MTNPPAVIGQIPAWAAREFGDRIAVVDGRRITFPDLAEEVCRAAAAMFALGIVKGDRVAIWAPNSYNWMLACLGAQMIGAVIVPLSTRLKGLEVQYILNRTRARILITTGNFTAVDFVELLIGLELPHLEHVLLFDDGWQELMSEAATSARLAAVLQQAQMVQSYDPADILFTSGTTGYPKGVVSSHRQTVQTFTAWLRQVGLVPTDRYLVVNPFFHSFGYKAGWLAGLMAGCTVYPQAILDVPTVCRLIATEHITVLPGPPTLFHTLLSFSDRGSYDLSSLRLSVTGSASIPPALITQMRDDLGFDTVLTAYGLTEAGVVSMSSPLDDPLTIATTAGKPLPGIEVRCLGGGSSGEGEILVRGFSVMNGYFEDFEATSEAIDREGWLHTGDVGFIDDAGYLHITDRIKDMFISGGFNCYPAEIERLLCQHPAVLQVAVIGVADQRLGEVGKAFVVLRPGQAVESAALLQWAKQYMSNYKVPSYVEFCTALPLNAAGKVQKFLLNQVTGTRSQQA